MKKIIKLEDKIIISYRKFNKLKIKTMIFIVYIIIFLLIMQIASIKIISKVETII